MKKHIKPITEKGYINVSNREKFVEYGQKLAHWDKALNQVYNALGVDLLEGIIGDMYNDWFSLTFDLLEGSYPDEMMDAANELLYETKSPSWEDFAKFYDKWKGV